MRQLKDHGSSTFQPRMIISDASCSETKQRKIKVSFCWHAAFRLEGAVYLRSLIVLLLLAALPRRSSAVRPRRSRRRGLVRNEHFASGPNGHWTKVQYPGLPGL
jgi:hypothetical protein